MSLDHFSKAELHVKLMNLQDRVADHLKKEPDVDIFLDQTNLFDDWEKVLPEAEYPIFVMAVLNNMRRDSIVNVILDAILKNIERTKKSSKNTSKTKLPISHVGEHPFS